MLERANVADSAPATIERGKRRFVELDRRPAAWRWKERRAIASAVVTSAIAVTDTVRTYKRSDALCSAGATRRLMLSRPGQRRRVEPLGVKRPGPCEAATVASPCT